MAGGMGERERAVAAEEYAGPCSLSDALAASEPRVSRTGLSTGLRVAVSTPGAEYVAVQRGAIVTIRRIERMSGHGGSVTQTGAWLAAADVPPTIQWRPG